MLLLFPFALTAETADEAKKLARHQFPEVGSSHLTEAIAAGFGLHANGGLRAALKASSNPLAYFSLARFGKRLVELGYQRPADYQTQQDVSWTAQCLVSLMIESGYQDKYNPMVDDGSILPIAAVVKALDAAGCVPPFQPNPKVRMNFKPWFEWRDSPRYLEFGPQTYAFLDRYGEAVNEMIGMYVSVREGEQLRSVTIVSGFGVHAESGTISYHLQEAISRAARLSALPNPSILAT